MLSEIPTSGALCVTSPFTPKQIHAIGKEEKVKYKVAKSWGVFFLQLYQLTFPCLSLVPNHLVVFLSKPGL